MTLLGRPHCFERGDKVYLTTPLTLMHPTDGQIDEFAFASSARTKAPNENIGWLQGRYVEAGKPNLNNAMWLSDELALKSLTPMLMPITVMHDPRTSVGVIADCKLVAPEGGSANARIDNVLAVWKHRYPEVWAEAEANVGNGQLMESMEAYAPSYFCSSCAQPYVKLPNGAEQASWCAHLRDKSGSRVLQDVCFTGTGLIFGSRGARGAYTEAYVDHFRDEIAEYHEKVHHDSTYRPTPQRSASMGLVQIEESELAALRSERNTARTSADELANDKRDLTTKLEKAEADLTAANAAKTAAETKATGLEEAAQATTLATTRLNGLGAGFMAKLGPTSKAALTELAGKLGDADWDKALAEREELAGVKRDATAEGGAAPAAGGAAPPPAAGAPAAPSFANEEVAAFMRSGVTAPAGTATVPPGASSVRALARAFKPKAPAAK